MDNNEGRRRRVIVLFSIILILLTLISDSNETVNNKKSTRTNSNKRKRTNYIRKYEMSDNATELNKEQDIMKDIDPKALYNSKVKYYKDLKSDNTFAESILLKQIKKYFFNLKPKHPNNLLIPENITDVYKGKWKQLVKPQLLEEEDLDEEKIKLVSLSEMKMKHKNVIYDDLKYTHNAGNMRLQLKATKTTIENIHYVNGFFDMNDGPSRTKKDISISVSGYYFSFTGKLILYSTHTLEEVNKLGLENNPIERIYSSTKNNTFILENEKNILWDTSGLLLKNAMDTNRIRATHTDTSCLFKFNLKAIVNTEGDAEFTNLEKIIENHKVDPEEQEEEFNLATEINAMNQRNNNHRRTSRVLSDLLLKTTKKHVFDYHVRKNFISTVQVGTENDFLSNRISFDHDQFQNNLLEEEDQDEELNRILQDINLQGIVESQNCNITFELNGDALKLDYPEAIAKIGKLALVVSFLTFMQIYLIVDQKVRHSNTQTLTANISIGTIGAMAMLDAYLTLVYLSASVVLESNFKALSLAAFLKLILFAIFELRLLLSIYKARFPNLFNDGWVAMRRELSVLYSKFYFALIFGVFVIYQLQSFSKFLVLIGMSFWIPQIITNAIRNCKRPFTNSFIFGMSFSRMFLPLYYFGCPYNFVPLLVEAKIKPYSPGFSMILIFYVGLQILLLYLQQKFGARSFIPKQFLPEVYDYFQPIPASITDRDCAICLNPVSDIEKESYMVTPCNHLFHSQCLNSWLLHKHECCICRSELPIVAQ